MNEPPKEPVKYVDSHVRLPYHYVAGDYRARQLRAFKDKKILGSKCSKTGKVFIPPIVNSPESFAPCTEFVELSDKGVVTTFCVVCAAFRIWATFPLKRWPGNASTVNEVSIPGWRRPTSPLQKVAPRRHEASIVGESDSGCSRGGIVEE